MNKVSFLLLLCYGRFTALAALQAYSSLVYFVINNARVNYIVKLFNDGLNWVIKYCSLLLRKFSEP